MEGTIRGGASRHVAAAVASAVIRTMATPDIKGWEHVAVPAVVADDVPVVASSMAVQRTAGTMLDTTFDNPGKAYEALRRVVPKHLANRVRKVNRAANAAKHPSQKASFKESGSSTDGDPLDQASTQT
eukprot:732654-Pyramimonas_sp.AAC.1